MGLMLIEKETIINWNMGDEDACVFTYEPNMKRRLAKYAAEYPDQCRLDYENEDGGVSYIFTDKSRISFRFVPPVTEEQRQKARERAMRIGLAENLNKAREAKRNNKLAEESTD